MKVLTLLGLLILGLSVGQCRTSSKKASADLSKTASQSNMSEGKYSLTNTLSVGAILTVGGMLIEPLRFGKLHILKVTVLKDTRADYARLYICNSKQRSLCKPSSQKPLEAATGIFYIYDLPIQDQGESVIITAQACLLESNSLTTKNCGEKSSNFYVADSIQLNTAEAAKLFAEIKSEEAKIQDQCQNIRNGLRNYLDSANGSQALDPNVLSAVQNQFDLTTPQMCKDFMMSDAFNALAAYVDKSDTKKSRNYLMVASLGTFSGLMALASMYGTFRLGRALFSKHVLGDAITELEAGEKAIKELSSKKKNSLTEAIKIKVQGERAAQEIQDKIADVQEKQSAKTAIEQELADRKSQVKTLEEEIVELDRQAKELQVKKINYQRILADKQVVNEESNLAGKLAEQEVQLKSLKSSRSPQSLVDLTKELLQLDAELKKTQAWIDKKIEIPSLGQAIEHRKKSNFGEMFDAISLRLPSNGNENAAIFELNNRARLRGMSSRDFFMKLDTSEKLKIFESGYNSLDGNYKFYLSEKRGGWISSLVNFGTEDVNLFPEGRRDNAKSVLELKTGGFERLKTECESNEMTKKRYQQELAFYNQNKPTRDLSAIGQVIEKVQKEIRKNLATDAAVKALERDIEELKRKVQLVTEASDRIAVLGDVTEGMLKQNDEAVERVAEKKMQAIQRQAALHQDQAHRLEELRQSNADAQSVAESIKDLKSQKSQFGKEALTFWGITAATSLLSVLGGAGAALSLEDSPQTLLESTLANAGAKIRESRAKIDEAWKHLESLAE